MQRQRFITMIKSVTEKKIKSLIGFHSANKMNNYGGLGKKKKKE